VDSGVNEGFTLRLSNDVDRDAVRGVTTVVTAPNEGQSVVREIRGYPEVERLHSTTGAWDLVVHCVAAACPSSTSSSNASASFPVSGTPRPACCSIPSLPRSANELH